MLEKIVGKSIAKSIATKIAVVSTALFLYSCGKDRCMEPHYGIKSSAELQATENVYVLGVADQAGNYATATCPSGCDYDSEIGCCWCPD